MLKWLGNLVDSNEKEIKRLQPIVDEINDLEETFKKLSDDELKNKTAEFKKRLADEIAEVKADLVKTQTHLDEARLCMPTIMDEFEKKDKEGECKQLEETIAHLQKEQHEIEEEVLDELLPEAFAAVREAARRTIKQRHYDVQLIGGMVLHHGKPVNGTVLENYPWLKLREWKIAEMRTGEGKTLVATLPLYLNSLTGRGCHLVTVNDYLSKRDHQWMGIIYHALGVSSSSIQHESSVIYDPEYKSTDARWPVLRPISRAEAYKADITYGTNNEFGFDYLRDNMVIELSQCVQRPLNFAIVDEVDNILIDEARTPLIISGPAEEAGDIYAGVENIISRMKMKVLTHEPVTQDEKDEEAALSDEYDYIAYEKSHTVMETQKGQETLARGFRMSPDDLFGERTNLTVDEARRRNRILSIFRQSMLAHAWYQKDRNYMVGQDEDGQPGIIIVDEFTGRLMHGRRYSEGLHQAIEAKEHLNVRRESMTYATVTFQNYFRMYAKLAGMTGTALTEAEEFHKIYKLDVVVIPTNKPMVRQDFSDRIFKDEQSKFKAVVNEVADLHKKGQPVLIGTVSIEKSEVLSDMMKRRGINHKVLNAKPEKAMQEADIVAQAGQVGAVTVATNMAGRGVDIVLGGNPTGRNETEWKQEHEKVIELGGLFIIGTERHEARRIDNQLRGRAGRQGDPGQSRFYVSLEDDIMKRFGGDRVKWIMEKVGMDEDTPIENGLINRSIESAQTRVEGYHFDIRKQLVEFDDVVNQQRELIYKERRKILGGADLKTNILSMVKEELQLTVAASAGGEYEGIDVKSLIPNITTIFPLPKDITPESLAAMKPEDLVQKLAEISEELYDQKEKEITPESMRLVERMIMLRTIDSLWIEHLTEMDRQRLQAGWAGLQQQKSIDSYKNLGAEQWQILTDDIRRTITHTIFHIGIVRQEPQQAIPATPMAKVATTNNRNNVTQAQKAGGKKVGRNDPCPCGSGKKYKNCHGR